MRVEGADVVGRHVVHPHPLYVCAENVITEVGATALASNSSVTHIVLTGVCLSLVPACVAVTVTCARVFPFVVCAGS